MPRDANRLYAVVRAIASFWIWFFFKSVDVRHPERVPATGPVLLCINHPNNLIDSLLVGAALQRKIHFLATATLFRNPVMARFLTACGAIPVHRKSDDPDRMDRNVDAFAACFAAFDRGSLVAIYPEGTTHAEAKVQRIKTGAARIALGYETGTSGPLALVPVGLTFEARKSFRGRVLISFGEPVSVAPYVPAFRDDPPKAVDALTTSIQWAMEHEVVHVDRVDTQALVRAVEELYRSELEKELREQRGLGDRQIDRFRLTQGIVDAVNHFKKRDPERVERLWQRIQSYQALRAARRVREESIRAYAEGRSMRRRVLTSWEAALGLPFFVYGIVVSALPYYLPRWLAHRMARKETDYATIRLLASIVAFPLFWSLETWLVWRGAGVVPAIVFAITLPVSGAIAYRYLVGAGRLTRRLRFTTLAVTHGQDARRLLTERQDILGEIERAKRDYLEATKGSSF